MPMFLIEGSGIDSGRKRKPLYLFAKTEAAAKARSRKQGIAPDSITLVKAHRLDTHVAGTSYKNPDGKDRQKLVKKCRIGERLSLQRETNNPHDAHAVRVVRTDGAQLGYIPQDVAEELVNGFISTDEGAKAIVQVREVRNFSDKKDSPITLDLVIVIALTSAEGEELSSVLRETTEQYGVQIGPPMDPVISVAYVPRRKTAAEKNPRHSSGRKSGCLGLLLIGATVIVSSACLLLSLP